MSDTNVRIKLSADGSAVRRELKLIDQEAQKLGINNSQSGKSSSSKRSTQSDGTKGSRATAADSKKSTEQERRDKTLTQLQRELTLIRKELQKINGTGGHGTSQTSNSPITSTPSIPSGGSGGGRNTPNHNSPSTDKGISSALGKLAKAATALTAVASARSYITSGAASSASGEYSAYMTYGTTGAYTDYYTAKKDATRLGSKLGYDYNTVMSAGESNMSTGGFTNLDNYNADMTNLMGASRALGIDPSMLAGSSGKAMSYGIVKSGDQKSFANLLAESIVEAQMTGREKEQLEVLNQISDNLASVNTTVTQSNLEGSLGMYNALVDQDENLKGSRGASLVNSMQDMATSRNSTLDVLAGFGTEYTGIEGKLALAQMAEQNPDEYWGRVYEGARRYGVSDTQLQYMIYNSGMSASQSKAVINALPGISSGAYNISDVDLGQSTIDKNLENYYGADVSTQQQYDIEKQDTRESVGEVFNNIVNPLRDKYNSLSTGGKIAVDAIGGGLSFAAGGKALNWGMGKLGNLITGSAKGSEGVSGIIPNLLGKSGEGLSGVTKGLSGAGSTVIKGLGKAAVPLAVITEGVSTMSEVNKDLEAGDNRGVSRDIGGGIGTVLGGIGGSIAAGAAIGSIVPVGGTIVGAGVGLLGGLIGAFAGNAIGEKAGEGVYDLSTGNDAIDSVEEGNTASLDRNTYALDELNKTLSGGGGDSASIFDGGGYGNDPGKLSIVGSGASSSSSSSSSSDTPTSDSSDSSVPTITAAPDSISDTRISKAASSSTAGTNNSSNGGLLSWFRNLFKGNAVGNDYIPYDNYMASLHKGEMVLNKLDADDYRRGKNRGSFNGGNLNLNVNVSGNIQGISPDNQNMITQAIIAQIRGSEIQGLLSNGFTRMSNY